jgi:hypothetical protein
MHVENDTNAGATVRLANDLWEVEICPAEQGRVTRLVDRADGRARVAPPAGTGGWLGEGGHRPTPGLECWMKQGARLDKQVDMIATFSPLRGLAPAVTPLADGVDLELRHAGFRLAIAWRLPAGAAPLSCRLELTCESAAADAHQFEGFFIWNVPAEEWAATVAALPGCRPVALHPFGEMRCATGESGGLHAAWWTRGTDRGVAIRGREGIGRFFLLVQNGEFVLGPHGRRCRLEPGESLTAAFDVAPLAWARANGWPCETDHAEAELAREEAGLLAIATRTGGVAAWTAATAGDPLPKRAVHLTFQLRPVTPSDAMQLLEAVIAPAGYNQAIIEVDRAFAYRSHPRVAPAWAWDRTRWQQFVRDARSLGIEPIPQFNTLGHQTECGLTGAYPDLREDPHGWGLCTRHPETPRVLRDILDELVDAFQPAACHIGLDEIDLHPVRRIRVGREMFGCCPRCPQADGAALFAEHVLALHAHLKSRGVETHMWADMLLHQPEHNSRFGLKAGTWRAIDSLPRDIVLDDWSYWPVGDYGGSRYLRGEGFRVMGATWHDTRVLAPFARFAADEGLLGMIQTTWTAPMLAAVPLTCLLLAGRIFANPHGVCGANAPVEAEALAMELGARRALGRSSSS